MSAGKNCPETPRQKMIGMMYLVLTAMLALNVSNEVLNGFDMVNLGLGESITSAEIRNKGLYDNFQVEAEKNPAKVKEWLDQAKLVKIKSDALVKYIQDVKFQIVKIADGDKADPNAVKIESREDIDAAGQFALGNGDEKLKAEINKFRDFIVQLTKGDPAKQAMYLKMFDTGNKKGKQWSDAMFESMPVAAVVTILSKYQSDIRTAESETVQYLRQKADLQDFDLNTLEVIINSESSYVLKGGSYNAEIFLAAYDKNKVSSYQYSVNNTSLGNNNMLKLGATSVGPHTFKASVRVPKNDGTWETYTSNPYQYIVGEPSATISNEDLNVVYRGIDNRFSISVPGVAADNVSVKVNGGTATKTGLGKYIIRPTQDGEISISVYGKISGKELLMGKNDYRVKYLPDPKSYLQYTDAGGVQRQIFEGNLTKRNLMSSGVSIVASYGQDELIKANFTVTSFTMQTVFGMINSNGSKLSSRQISDIERLEGGDIITFKNIKAVGPDGKVRSPGLIQVTI